MAGGGLGLGAAGVALVAGSAVSLTFATCDGPVTAAINGTAALVAYYYSSAWIFVVLIFSGAPVDAKEGRDLQGILSSAVFAAFSNSKRSPKSI